MTSRGFLEIDGIYAVAAVVGEGVCEGKAVFLQHADMGKIG
jgi:hypothetical protein